MKFHLTFALLLALVPQVAWSQVARTCNLSATTPSEVDTDRQLTNADTAALTEAAKRGDDITGCDVSEITDMSGLFYFHPNSFNQDIGDWDVSKVTNMDNMFRQTYVFNQDIGGWNTSSVTSMVRTFVFSYDFNQDISGWDVSSVTSFFATFESATDFNQDILGWNVSSATTFQGMFMNATAMNANFSAPDWPTSSFFSDSTAPTVSSSTPSDNATGVAVDANIVLTFSEVVDAETGSIVLKKVSDGSTIETFDVTSAVTGSGTTTITINPTADLASSTAYYVEIASTAFDDAASNSYAGITGSTTLNFETAAPANSAPVANAGSDQTVASAAAVTLDGSGSSDADSGDTLTYAWTQTSGATVTLSSATAQQPTFTAPSLNVGDADAVLVFSLVVNDGIVNSSADTVTITVEAPASTPASEFAAHEAEIRNTLVGDASRSLRSSVAANRRLAQSARERFIEFSQAQAREEDVTRALIPFDIGGNFTLSESGLNTSGNFFQQVGNEEGTYRRLFFGDFDVQHDNDTDSTTATLTGRMAWEHMTSEQTMLGYFIGGELATSNIGGSFEGDQDRIGVTAGGYVVHELSEQVYFDGSASVGAGRNDLEMANDTLALESEYTTQTATLGGAITGVYSQKGYDFQPELALSFGKTWLGNVGFTGRAYGLTDDALSLDAGTVSIANLTFRPEVIIPISADFVADTNMQFTYAPRLICEQIKSTTKTSDCGTGGELGFSSTSEDALSSADMRILLDRINSGTRSSFVFSVEHKF
ncbi:BspA family leucine-rich repeat surface protein [Nereida sp.]|uniref:BspA family leucine-rich repeat surface protein n=1 Tax=Nereida sp. TaxID=2736090 RepID=UPI003F69AE69